MWKYSKMCLTKYSKMCLTLNNLYLFLQMQQPTHCYLFILQVTVNICLFDNAHLHPGITLKKTKLGNNWCMLANIGEQHAQPSSHMHKFYD